MSRVTLRKLNRWIAKRFPGLDIELVRGREYFYFSGDDGFDQMPSIFVAMLSQATLEQWQKLIEASARDAGHIKEEE